MLDLDMGKYAMFVWPAWGLSLGLLALMAFKAVSDARATAQKLAELELELNASEDKVPTSETKAA